MTDTHKINKSYVQFISGYISGVVTSVICAPLDITRTRLNLAQTSLKTKQGFFNMMSEIYTRHGFKGYYDGFSATLAGVPIFQFLYFGIYYNLKGICREVLKGKQFSSDVTASILSGSICQVLTNPIWVVRVRMQADQLHYENKQDRKYKKLLKSFEIIYKEEGIVGFYKGTLASLMGNFLHKNYKIKCV